MSYHSPAYDLFWKKCPALLYGIAMVVGCCLALGKYLEALLIGLAILLPLLVNLSVTSKQLFLKLALALALSLVTMTWVSHAYHFSPLPPEGIKGEGYITLSSLSQQEHVFGKKWIYKGTLRAFKKEGKEEYLQGIKNVPLTISFSNNGTIKRPPSDYSYLIKGSLKTNKMGKYYLQVSPLTPWKTVSKTWNLAEMRYDLKKNLKEKIDETYRSPSSQTFLKGIAIGEFNDRLMAQDFGRLGLQHIMAISGFHFSIIAGFFSLLFARFFSTSFATAALVILLTSYFIFLGPSPSIMRAWMMALVICLSVVFERHHYGLNTLGVATIGVILYDPLQVTGMGFIFSFCTTGAILLLYSPIDECLQKIFYKRSLSAALEMTITDKHAYILLSFLRQSFSLMLAVNLIAIPITLLYFQKFPLLGLAFNIFYPFLVSLAILLLLIGLVIGTFLPIVGNQIHLINDLYTQLILNFTTYTPKSLDAYITTPEFDSAITTTFILCIFVVGIYCKSLIDKYKDSRNDWAFV